MRPRHSAVLVILFTLLGVPALGQGTAPTEPPPDTPAETPPVSPAAEATAPAVSDPPTREEIQARIDVLGEDENSARDALREALGFLERRASLRERREQSDQNANEAPALLQTIRRELETPPEDVRLAVPADATLTQLEQKSSEANAELELARAQVAELQAEATRRQERRTQIPEAIAAARQRLSEIAEASAASAVNNGAAEQTAALRARTTRRAAERAALEAEIAALQSELNEYDARREVLPARRDRAARRVAQAEKVAQRWQELVRNRRQVEAEAAAQEARRLRIEAAKQHPVLEEFADASEQLAEARTLNTGLPNRAEAAETAEEVAEAELAQIRQQYKSVSDRIEIGGLTRATGLLLRRHFDALNEGITNPERLTRRVESIRRETEQALIQQIEREEAEDEAENTEAVVAELMDRIDASGVEPENRESAEAAARELAEARRQLLGELVGDSSRYVEALEDREEAMSDLLGAVRAYESYIRERILWVRSISKEDPPGLAELRRTAGQLSDPDEIGASLERTAEEAGARWPILLISGASVVLLFVAGRWSKNHLGVLAERVSRFRTDSFGLTLAALVLTFAAALPGGVLLYWLGSFLAGVTNQTLPGQATGSGLIAAGQMLIALAFAAGVFRPGGLAEVNFRWPSEIIKQIRRIGRWFIPAATASVGVLAASDTIGTEDADGTLGRIAFSALLIVSTLALALIAKPDSPLAVLVARRGGWTERLRVLWMPMLPLTPLATLVITWLGFFYTARQLGQRVEVTLALAFILLLVNGVLTRWLFVARRQVAVEDARRRREQAIAEKAAETKAKSEKPTEGVTPAIDEDKLDLPAISQQTQQFFRTGILVAAVIGIYAAWADVLPALRMLDRVQIYPSIGVIEAEATERLPILEPETVTDPGEAAQEAAQSNAQAGQNGAQRPSSTITDLTMGGLPMPAQPEGDDTPGEILNHTVSLADLGLAVVLLVATVIAFRNLPGLAEIVVLQRLPLDAGSRYALSTVLRYAIAFVGIVAAFGAIDITWSNIQWLAAALTFGLAFGLQEIFANFVSGLIILAERPIRIGDTVTVDTVNGTVTRIRMRATTVTDWDRKELIIPNKKFITGDVYNWTLSDPILRLNLPIGVGYGEDVRLAEQVLLRVAGEVPDILPDPKPYVYFNGFGDSTLSFELRVHLPHIEKLIGVKHNLHMRITEAFREEGIEIAFPQRDLHIRSIEGLEGLQRFSRGPEAGSETRSDTGPITPPE